MKKITLALMAVMLVLGMTQCKKEQPTPTPDPTPDGETVYISMKVDDGGKHIVYPGTGAYVFEDGDKIYVGNNGHYVGTLTYGNGTFSGSITSPSTSDYLHFYFTGGKTPSSNPKAGTTTSFTVDISDQSSKLPVLSYGRSHIKYVNGTTAYSCMLENQCGLVKFIIPNMTPGQQESSFATRPISIEGMKTTANINFALGNEGIAPVDNAIGAVTLYSVSSNQSSTAEKWAVLLPQEEVTYPDAKVNFYGLIANIASVPAVTPNMYYTEGVVISRPIAIQAKAGGDNVYFSQGNLQFVDSYSPTAYWKFADNQWDIVGNAQQNPYGYSHPEKYDLFGWGTSGWNSGANSNSPYYYQPTSRGTGAKNYGPGSHNLTGDYANADWGWYNPISNGGNTANLWRTLTKDEWNYLINTRSNAVSRRGFGIVNGVKGLILLFSGTPEGFTPGNDSWENGNNIFTLTQWQPIEAAGAIFLPLTGRRNNGYYGQEDYGHYWSTDAYFDFEGYSVNFDETDKIVINSQDRSYGFSVRLVAKVNDHNNANF